MTDIEATYRSFVQCLNSRRWDDFHLFIENPFVKNGQVFTPESYAANTAATGGDFEILVDAVTVDREGASGRKTLGSALLVKIRRFPVPAADGKNTNSMDGGVGVRSEEGKTVEFSEQNIVTFSAAGKLASAWNVSDRDAIREQLASSSSDGDDDESSKGYKYNADLIAPRTSHASPAPQDDGGRREGKRRLTTNEMREFYGKYLDCINTQTMQTGLSEFCHEHVVHNKKTLSLGQYRGLVQEAFTAVPDIHFRLQDANLVADEKMQRIAARIDFTGTPVGKMAGVEPPPSGGGSGSGDGGKKGKTVNFAEQVTYQLRDEKIERVWSIVDWTAYREQVLGK